LYTEQLAQLCPIIQTWSSIPFATATANKTVIQISSRILCVIFAFLLGLATHSQSFAQSLPVSASPYVLDGYRLGEPAANISYRSDMNCKPSELFASFAWCTHYASAKTTTGTYNVANAVIVSASDRIVYGWKMIRPADFSNPGDIDSEITRLSRTFKQEARILRFPTRPGQLNGLIAIWGAISLTPLDQMDMAALASGKQINRGLLVDFLGDFGRSAREGAPIYLIGGGPGMLYSAFYDDTRKGNLRVAIVDASQLTVAQPSMPPYAAQSGASPNETLGAESTLLDCKFPERTIGGVVVFWKLNKIRIWYGDGGGEEWDGVNLLADPISTTNNSIGRIVLSRDLKNINYNSGAEHSIGSCVIGATSRVPAFWLEPKLRQPWESSAVPAIVQTTPVAVETAAANQSDRDIEIPLKKSGGTYILPVTLNNKFTLDFTLDSGASDVQIPADVALTLARTGSVNDSDFLGKRNYTLADGSTKTSQTFRIRSLKVGSYELTDVMGSISDVSGSLLLGQSFLGRLKHWSIDNEREVLVIR
jgi:predicted aspartyl protease